MSAPFTAHYISGTHWDREWYQSFQDYRIRLVQVMDGVLDALESDARLASFHGDGQMSMIQDYLEIRPENTTRLARLAQAGRIVLGPWFVLPDELLVSGEALLRNLQLGHRLARALGADPMKFGYLCDEFGHISQMPQVLNNFGIDAALIGRGTNEHSHPAHFVWQSPDGSRVLTYKEPDEGGYGSTTAAVQAHRSAVKRRARDDDGQITDHLDQPGVDERLRELVEHELGRTKTGLVMLIDALDHYPIFKQAPEMLERLRALFPEGEFVHSSLPAYAAAMREHAAEMPVFRGEQRNTARCLSGYLWLISNCLSSRYPIKKANDANQTLLERWAEPYLFWANLAGAKHLPPTFLDAAWRLTLTNHAHDSICGCSIDQVHKDMEYRSDQAHLIGEGVVRKALQTLAPEQQTPLADPIAFQVALAQAEPYARRAVSVFDIGFLHDWGERYREAFIGEDKNSFRLLDAGGNDVPYQLLSVDRARTIAKEDPDSLVQITKRDVHTVAAEVSLPALGYTTLQVQPAQGPVRVWGTLRTGPLSADNGLIAVSVNSNGTLRLTDKATGRAYDQLLSFAENGDVGDGWFHVAPTCDETITSAASTCDAGVIADGPLMVTFRLRTRMQVPETYDWRAARRLQQRAELVITSDVTIKKGERALFVQTTVDNNVTDHRLRVLLPTGMKTDTWWVDLPFDLVERAIALDPACVNDKELIVPEKNMLAVAALCEETAGLAFVSGGGLHEAAAHDDEQRTLAITLLRGFRRPAFRDDQPGGQIIGQHTFSYALAPVDGAADLPRVLALRDQLATGLRVHQTEPGFGLTVRNGSLLALEPAEACLSALKPAADGKGAILRVYNPLPTALTVYATPGFAVTEALLSNGAEEYGTPLRITGNRIKLSVAAKSIASARLLTR